MEFPKVAVMVIDLPSSTVSADVVSVTVLTLSISVIAILGPLVLAML